MRKRFRSGDNFPIVDVGSDHDLMMNDDLLSLSEEGEKAKPRKVSIGSRNITNLPVADNIDALAEEEQELEALVESLVKICTRYKMEISAKKTKLMTNSASGTQREIKVKGQKLGSYKLQVPWSNCFRYGLKPEILSRIAQTTAAFTKLKQIWRGNNISLG